MISTKGKFSANCRYGTPLVWIYDWSMWLFENWTFHVLLHVTCNWIKSKILGRLLRDRAKLSLDHWTRTFQNLESQEWNNCHLSSIEDGDAKTTCPNDVVDNFDDALNGHVRSHGRQYESSQKLFNVIWSCILEKRNLKWKKQQIFQINIQAFPKVLHKRESHFSRPFCSFKRCLNGESDLYQTRVWRPRYFRLKIPGKQCATCERSKDAVWDISWGWQMFLVTLTYSSFWSLV